MYFCITLVFNRLSFQMLGLLREQNVPDIYNNRQNVSVNISHTHYGSLWRHCGSFSACFYKNQCVFRMYF